jgi:hypothetical protein
MNTHSGLSAQAFEHKITTAISGPGFKEHSIKFKADGHFSRNRFLLSYPRNSFLPDPVPLFLKVTTDLGIDVRVLEPMLFLAQTVHFGYEPDGPTHKVYLEFLRNAEPDGNLMFMSLKSKGDDTALNSYTRMSKQSCRRLLNDLSLAPAIDEVISESMDMAFASGGDLLDITDPAKDRRSIDISFAYMDLLVRDLPELDGLIAAYPFIADVLKSDMTKKLGHFAAGQGVDGVPFFTIYYGAHVLP